MTYTEEELERAARWMCEQTGENPDSVVSTIDANGLPDRIPAWKAALPSVHALIEEALRIAREG